MKHPNPTNPTYYHLKCTHCVCHFAVKSTEQIIFILYVAGSTSVKGVAGKDSDSDNRL
jgi:hypothetical protein